MVWLFAEKQSSIFIEFFNSIGRFEKLRQGLRASPLEKADPLESPFSEAENDSQETPRLETDVRLRSPKVAVRSRVRAFVQAQFQNASTA